ncbi:uncharacterized protein [Ptychodera flava]|uniref:uncharacterized protein n=1 Tax=Ptychodera flava TaxID=63121 RepID=UPI00396A2897
MKSLRVLLLVAVTSFAVIPASCHPLGMLTEVSDESLAHEERQHVIGALVQAMSRLASQVQRMCDQHDMAMIMSERSSNQQAADALEMLADQNAIDETAEAAKSVDVEGAAAEQLVNEQAGHVHEHQTSEQSGGAAQTEQLTNEQSGHVHEHQTSEQSGGAAQTEQLTNEQAGHVHEHQTFEQSGGAAQTEQLTNEQAGHVHEHQTFEQSEGAAKVERLIINEQAGHVHEHTYNVLDTEASLDQVNDQSANGVETANVENVADEGIGQETDLANAEVDMGTAEDLEELNVEEADANFVASASLTLPQTTEDIVSFCEALESVAAREVVENNIFLATVRLVAEFTVFVENLSEEDKTAIAELCGNNHHSEFNTVEDGVENADDNTVEAELNGAAKVFNSADIETARVNEDAADNGELIAVQDVSDLTDEEVHEQIALLCRSIENAKHLLTAGQESLMLHSVEGAAQVLRKFMASEDWTTIVDICTSGSSSE